MHIILGGTGHVGSVVAQNLLKNKEPCLIVGHDPAKAEEWKRRGAQFAVVDVRETARLSEIFQEGETLFLLNPPADPATDTVREEKLTLHSILAALLGSSIRKIVGESTYGAQPGDGLGDLAVLYDMELALMDRGYHNSIIRAAYYYSNWDMQLDAIRDQGMLTTMYPGDFQLPMVSPKDLGRIAADLMQAQYSDEQMIYVEGPQWLSPNDVAAAFANQLGQNVEVKTIPPSEWMTWLMNGGFSEKAAQSMARMTEATLRDVPKLNVRARRGSVTIEEHVQELVHNFAGTSARALEQSP